MTMVHLNKPQDAHCEGCGAASDQPHRDPLLDLLATERQDDSSQIITEVHGRLRREITQEAYQRDLRYAEDLCLPVCEWSGEDRSGKPMAISWVCTTNGRVLSAYEITGRA